MLKQSFNTLALSRKLFSLQVVAPSPVLQGVEKHSFGKTYCYLVFFVIAFGGEVQRTMDVDIEKEVP